MSLTSACRRLRHTNSPGGTPPLSPRPPPNLATPEPGTSRFPRLPRAPGCANTPRRPPRRRLAPTARCWRSPRRLGVTRTSTPETRRPALPPRPLGPGQAQQPLPSRGAAAPPGLPCRLTRPRWAPPDRAAHLPRGAPAPGEGGRKKSLVYWAGDVPDWIRYPSSAVPFLLIPGAGGERVATG